MGFVLYKDKTSMKKENSRYLQGGVSDIGKNYIRWWERRILKKDDNSDVVYVISRVYAAAPDLIAYDYYGRNDLGWLILQYNNVVDINEELAVGKAILLPSKDRVFYEMVNHPY
jgi:hypothetical protein